MLTGPRNSANRRGAELEERTLSFAAEVVRFVGNFSVSEVARVIGRQLLRSGTSIGANYREANRAESSLDFAHKVALAVKEAAETEYWLLLCRRTIVGASGAIATLLSEVDELLAILSTILRRARRVS